MKNGELNTMKEIKGYTFPEELYYHKEHAWVKMEPDGTVRIGMNDFYQKSAGDTTYIDLPFEGDAVTQGETCGKIQSAKWVGKFVSPISGQIVKVNNELEDDCTLINKSPYERGWIMVVKPSKINEELQHLFHGAQVEPWVKKEIEDAEKKKK
jgi:glycine cleavage system H protein